MSTSFLKSPKEEELENSTTQSSHSTKEAYVKEELEGFLGIGDEENLSNDDTYGEPSWDFIDWEEQQLDGEEYDQDGRENKGVDFISNFFEEESQCLSRGKVIKSEINLGFWDGEDQKGCLKLNLNYQDVLDAWSDRGHLCAQGYSFSLAGSGYYSGEVPVMEEERTSRREASVLRYKEKRQTRFFAKKIRYQVRKLNADKRPRLKGRFVKRTS